MWIISYSTESGCQGRLPYVFKDEPTRATAIKLAVAYCTWEYYEISYVSGVDVEKIENSNNPLDTKETNRLLHRLSEEFKETTGCSLEDSEPWCGF